MSIFNNSHQSPLTFSLANMPDITTRLDNVDIYDINLFLIKHPNLAPGDRHDNQPNDITKLSLKMMSEYILNFGIVSEDTGLTPISVYTPQTFNTVSYIHKPVDPDTDRGQRPATILDVVTKIKDVISIPIINDLISTNAFAKVNTITPDYILSLDARLTPEKLFNVTNKNYTELAVDNFLYFDQAVTPQHTPASNDGLLTPSTTTILANHTHSNMLYKADLTTPAITVSTTTHVGTSGDRARVITDGTTVVLSARHYTQGNPSVKFLTPVGRTAVSAGTEIVVVGNPEDKINANGIEATCLNNVVPSVDDKLSIRYRARHYKIFEKQI